MPPLPPIELPLINTSRPLKTTIPIKLPATLYKLLDPHSYYVSERPSMNALTLYPFSSAIGCSYPLFTTFYLINPIIA